MLGHSWRLNKNKHTVRSRMLTIFISSYKADLLPFKQNTVNYHQLLLIWNNLHIQCGIWQPTQRTLMIFPSSPPAAFPAERAQPVPQCVTSLDTTTTALEQMELDVHPPPFQPGQKAKTTGITDKCQAPESDFSLSEGVLIKMSWLKSSVQQNFKAQLSN